MIFFERILFCFRMVQHSLLFDYGFLRRLMSELRNNSDAAVRELNDSDIDIVAEIGKVEQKAREREDERQLLAGARGPLLGHLVQIAQVNSVTLVVFFSLLFTYFLPYTYALPYNYLLYTYQHLYTYLILSYLIFKRVLLFISLLYFIALSIYAFI